MYINDAQLRRVMHWDLPSSILLSTPLFKHTDAARRNHCIPCDALSVRPPPPLPVIGQRDPSSLATKYSSVPMQLEILISPRLNTPLHTPPHSRSRASRNLRPKGPPRTIWQTGCQRAC